MKKNSAIPPALQRFLWFIALWAAGVMTLAAAGAIIRFALLP